MPSLLTTCFCLLATVGAAPPGALLPLSSYTLYDGDTFTKATIRVDFGIWKQSWEQVTVRFADVDAPEVTRARQTVGGVTDAEIAFGKLVKAKLAEFIDGCPVYISPTDASAYGRIEAQVFVWKDDKLQDVIAWLKTNKYQRSDMQGK